MPSSLRFWPPARANRLGFPWNWHANHFHGFNPTSYIDPGILSQYDPPSNFVNPQPTVLTFEPSVAPPPMVAHYPTGHGTLAELDDTGDALASYLEITHTPPQGLACDFCPYQAKTRRDVDRHIISVHKKEQKYFCPEPRCRRHTVGWPRKDLRNRHLKSVHRNSTKKPGTDATTPPTLNGSPRSISTSPASSPGQPRDLLLDDVFEHGLQQLASGAPESIDKLKTQLTDKEKQLSEVKEQLSEMVKQLCETRKERDQAHEQLKVVTAQMEEQLRAVTAQMEEQRKTYEVRQEKFLSIVDQMDTKGAW